jgi:hypothetical protein
VCGKPGQSPLDVGWHRRRNNRRVWVTGLRLVAREGCQLLRCGVGGRLLSAACCRNRSMNLAAWAESNGVARVTAYRWFRAGQLPVPARKVGRLILVDAPVGERGPRELTGMCPGVVG